MAYDHTNIKILSEEELNQFDFIYVQELANEYHKDPRFIQRGLEAARLSNYPIEDWIQRYLKHDLATPATKELLEISMELQKEAYTK